MSFSLLPAVPVLAASSAAALAGRPVYQVRCEDGVDVTNIIEADAARLWTLGGGVLQLPPSACRVGGDRDLDITADPGVTIRGSVASAGWVANNATAPYTLLLDPRHTIKLGSHSALFGLRIARQGIGAPTDLREALTEVARFAGTALTLSGIRDVTLDYVTINGFATAISQKRSDRVHYDHVMGDDTNFLALDGCGDTCTAYQMEAWDFVTGPYNISPQQEAPAIRAFGGSRGEIEVALSRPPRYPFQTGDTIIIGNTTHTYQPPNGRYTITRIDDTHFMLNGSSYSGHYPAMHEVAFLGVGLRKGTAFSFQHTGMILTALTDYGHDVSLHYGAGTGGMQCVGCWLDGDNGAGTNGDPVPIGIVNGALPGKKPVPAQQNKFIGGGIYDKAISIYNNSSTNRPLLVTNVSPLTIVGCAANALGAGVAVASGGVLVSNSDFEGNSDCLGRHPFAVYNGASLLRLDGVRVEGRGAPYYQTESRDCPKFVRNNEIRCSWVPRLQGAASPGVETRASGFPVGHYTEAGDRITLWGHIKDIALRGATGPVVITGLPGTGAATHIDGICSISGAAGVALSPGRTVLSAVIDSPHDRITLNQLRFGLSASPIPLPADPAHLAAAAGSGAIELEFVCNTWRR
ncbi:MAG TPA: hypothetical protein VM755_00905 [Stellaceae bacterium]|nr:hypothetical protein [Stellaceae bacterium]